MQPSETTGQQGQDSGLFERLHVERVKAILQEALQRRLVFLIIGRTGVGKSSTINTLIGKEVAEVNPLTVGTQSVKLYQVNVQGVLCEVVDTPGLCDELEETNDHRYLEEMKQHITSFDCFWFVTPLHETRVRADEKRGIRLISEAFGADIWKKAVIVFTFADLIKPEKYAEQLQGRTVLIRAEIARFAGEEVADQVPGVAVSNESPVTPDGQPWLGELYTKVFIRISAHGALPFMLATAHRVDLTGAPPSASQAAQRPLDARITFTPSQRQEMKKSLLEKRYSAEFVSALTAVGAGVGVIFGPGGAAIGGAIGATIGLIAWLIH